MPDPFVPLGDAAAGLEPGLAARRPGPDAEVIDLAGRVERLIVREDRLMLRTVEIEDGVFRAMRQHPWPERAGGEPQITSERTVEPDGTRVMTLREPAGWEAKCKASHEAHEAALADRTRREEAEEARRGLPWWNKLRGRATARLERWGLRLAEMKPVTQAGLAAKAAAAAAAAEGDELPDEWRQKLAISLSRDVVRLSAAPSEAADSELFDLVSRLGSALRVTRPAGALHREAHPEVTRGEAIARVLDRAENVAIHGGETSAREARG